MLLQMAGFPSFSWLNDILLWCVCVCVYTHYIYIHIYIYTYIYTHTYIKNVFFIHSSVDGHIVCFHVLAVVNNAAEYGDTDIILREWFHFLSICTPRSGIAGSYGISIFIFWGTSILFSIIAVPIYISSNSAQGFPFLHILTNAFYLLSFWWQSFWQMWDDSSLWFRFAFL